MVKNPIKVFGRLKPVVNKIHAEEYEVNHSSEDSETLTFNLKPHSFISSKPESVSYRFQKVFTTSNQEEVFDIVAKPVVDSVLQGYNGTIFAYGQTGSGKTYSMTGGLAHYEDRGVIPRTIQHVFQHFTEAGLTHSTYISYLEIYNECGYDLLNPHHKVSKLDDLPKVTLLEDTNGTLHLRNLSVHPVGNEEEALNLLFLGDTNRMISETPMNPSSSRSHCVFTVHIASRSATSSAVRRSKLHLIDLAGSERVHKTGIDGNLLVEARHINLSLHFLEQVIVALGDSRRSHVPYRNSMMTTVLRDSLGGNCMTAMLATLSSNKNNIEETLSTCRFAQRVALVRNEALVNEERDPQQEIALLRADVRRLREQITALTTADTQQVEAGEGLDTAEETECRAWVQEYLRRDSAGSTGLAMPSDPRRVRACFSMLREAACSPRSDEAAPDRLQAKVASQVEHFRDIIRQRDSEISILINLLRKEKRRTDSDRSYSPMMALTPSTPHTPTSPQPQAQAGQAEVKTPAAASEFEPDIQRLTGQSFTLAEREAFKLFAADRRKRIEVEMTKEALKAKYEEARKAAAKIKQIRKRVVALHNEMKQLSDLDPAQSKRKATVMEEMEKEQANYRQTLVDLQLLKVETGLQKHAMEQAKLRLLRKFQDWWAAQISTSSAQPSPAVPPRPRSCQEPRAAPRNGPVQLQPARPGSAGATLNQALDKYASVPPVIHIWARAKSPPTRTPTPTNSVLEDTVCLSSDATCDELDTKPEPAEECASEPLVVDEDENDIKQRVPLTGDPDIDREIVEFYKARSRLYHS